MPWKIRIAESAKKDITEIKKWYSEQSPVAAKNFTFELISAIESLQKENIEHKKAYGNYRRLLLKKFPFVIYYNRLYQSEITEIIAILHNKRDRSFVMGRLH